MSMDFRIRKMRNEDYFYVAKIYKQAIDDGKSTFQTTAPVFEKWDENHHIFCRYAAVDGDDKVLGWIALSPTKKRYAYRGVAEVSVYVRDGFRKNGIGRALIEEVKANAAKDGIWTLESSIFKSNDECIRLHTRCGFRMVGERERIAQNESGEWIDTVIMEYRMP